MIKITNFNPINTYTCQVCQKEIETTKEYSILKHYSPVCSSRCIFVLFYRKISSLDKKTLLMLGKILKIKDYSSLKEQKLVFEITKKYPKPTLSNINKEVSSISIKN